MDRDLTAHSLTIARMEGTPLTPTYFMYLEELKALRGTLHAMPHPQAVDEAIRVIDALADAAAYLAREHATHPADAINTAFGVEPVAT